ncbi:MAG: hypothetical protein IAE84_03835 [Saprospiraceae bacterium]|nr:hypothetical protein [Saprospiraceae bacterium]
MQQTEFKYPVFEANQVLTNAHLNEVFNYLEEQGRLTRANLIGIGIVCGLEISLNAAGVRLTRGCGVTSEGYLIIEPEDVTLTAYRDYTIPTEVDYPPFKTGSTQYPLWELFPAGTPSTTPLNAAFLADKAVLLFLELKKDGLRNCSPNDCNDKGAEMTVTVRRLLIARSDLDSIIAAANGLNTNLTTADLEAVLTARLNLPDLRLPRYDVPNTGPVTSNQVWRAFFDVFQRENLAAKTGQAFTAAYQAFHPILQDIYPSDPFAGFAAAYGFLDVTPQNDAQVRFLQYYYDLFDDLLKAYDEFRAQGMELLCACCPSEGLFPRHLMLGALALPASVNPAIYRHHFITSAAVGNCEQRTAAVVQLFRRLVEMTLRFSNNPPLPAQETGAKHDSQIKITPSKLGDVPVSEKAIPYYYLQNGDPALYQLWNPAKTRIRRANQNLSYRADEYAPAAPGFVTQPLRYDLEPNNFLRVEGHLGKQYRSVLQTLLLHKRNYRLSIDIIALRTGVYDENAPLDLTREGCRFQDLEAMYDVYKSELLCTFCKALKYFYRLSYSSNIAIGSTVPSAATVPLLNICSPGLMVQPRTIGAIFEVLWPQYAVNSYYSPTQGPNSVVNILQGMNPDPTYNIFFYITYYLAKFTEVVTEDIRNLDLGGFEGRISDIATVAELIERNKEAYLQSQQHTGAEANLPLWEEIDDVLDTLSKACHLDAFKTLHAEYTRRVRELSRKQYLSHFLEQHPGIQHKAGAPLGGTFIIVYHEPPTPPATPNTPSGQLFESLNFTQRVAVEESLRRIMANPAAVFTEREIANLSQVLTGLPQVVTDVSSRPPAELLADSAIAAAVSQLPAGTVIADFFLPYLCCSDCAPVQFVLAPEQALELETCEYRWASRDSFLRDLQRDYTFTIRQYTINGSSVITTPRTITIPVATIRTGGLQAVAAALNALGGLVFGVGTIYSYLTIQRYSNHTFQLVIQEAGETDVFAYTQDGVTLNGSAYNYGLKRNCTNRPDTEEPQPCTLPCGGVVRTCRYRLPITRAKVVTVESLVVIISENQGVEIPQAAGVNPMIVINPDTGNVDFAALFSHVAQLYPQTVLASHALSFAHNGDTPGMVAISRYECHDFRLQIVIDRESFTALEFNNRGLFRAIPDAGLELISPTIDCQDENRCP